MASLSRLVQCLQVRLLASPANIGPGCRGFPGTNAFAYYEYFLSSVIKGFIALASAFSIPLSFDALLALSLLPMAINKQITNIPMTILNFSLK
jgi:hypothetical protein